MAYCIVKCISTVAVRSLPTVIMDMSFKAIFGYVYALMSKTRNINLQGLRQNSELGDFVNL